MPPWGKFKKLDLARTEDRLKALILVCGLLIAVLAFTAGAINMTMSPNFCNQCHVMAPEYSTWKASSHLQVSCTDCHIEPGLGNLVVHKLSAVKELYLYFTVTYELPIKMAHKINDQVCTGCHSINRNFTPSGDLIIPHDRHAAKKVFCVDCHNGVAHGNIVARKLTEDGNYEVWTDDYGKQQMVKDYTEPKMNKCLDCHINPGKYGIKNIKSVTQACEACHSQISKPSDHKVDNFLTTHGKLAKLDVEYCNKCHSYSVEVRDVPVQDSLARYARGNVFCYECHQKRPVGHGENWKMSHRKGVTGQDVTGCLVCHNYEKPTPEMKAVPTNCTKCHGQGAGQSGGKQGGSSPGGEGQSGTVKFEKTHPVNWRKLHPSIVKEKGASNEGCWNCHETTHCSACHTNKL